MSCIWALVLFGRDAWKTISDLMVKRFATLQSVRDDVVSVMCEMMDRGANQARHGTRSWYTWCDHFAI